ncbi:uncharacterized protein EI90DRAFT_148491 [Cantharellus anzutake]|uniref:uncharacterized protein n=1 Tax=Cantharellus anzutake TaxID=1750568 RepID=UPI001903C654|nr:uncharacterized protein EI90DRAFT_148491 [Cantharellus anzutake]KAF8317510.1 hypothetical protein EI90DRAFT_148491 [Cantharellus anzutake]
MNYVDITKDRSITGNWLIDPHVSRPKFYNGVPRPRPSGPESDGQWIAEIHEWFPRTGIRYNLKLQSASYIDASLQIGSSRPYGNVCTQESGGGIRHDHVTVFSIAQKDIILHLSRRDEHAVRLFASSKYGDVQVYLPDNFSGVVVHQMLSNVDIHETCSSRVVESLYEYEIQSTGLTKSWLGDRDSDRREDELYIFAPNGRVHILYHGESILTSYLLAWKIQQCLVEYVGPLFAFLLFFGCCQNHASSSLLPLSGGSLYRNRLLLGMFTTHSSTLEWPCRIVLQRG